ncbi:MAG: hypothetical protein K6F60_07095 [Eubacterium sp.]|nr:hypothetical protein [Eubacterium sp.]
MGKDNQVVYEDGTWSIELRPRNNVHAGEPTVKVWVLMMGKEVAKFSNKFRGYGHYNTEEMLDPTICAAAKKTWEMLKEGDLTPELVEKIRTDISDFIKSSPAPAAAESAE